MGCAPSALDDNTATPAPNGNTTTAEVSASDNCDRLRRSSSNSSHRQTDGRNGHSSENNCANNGQDSVQGSNLVREEIGRSANPIAGEGDEDSEGESASLLCANLRRNFMTSGSRIGSTFGGGRAGGRRSRSSSGAAASIQPALTTTEEQNESFVSGEEGENNPLLRHSAAPTNPALLCEDTSRTSEAGGEQHSLSISSPVTATATQRGSQSLYHNLPHYIQLQQYQSQQNQHFPFHMGRKFSNHLTEKVSQTPGRVCTLRDRRVWANTKPLPVPSQSIELLVNPP